LPTAITVPNKRLRGLCVFSAFTSTCVW
jgi:hypothetical protein